LAPKKVFTLKNGSNLPIPASSIQNPASIICITPEATNKDPYRMTAEIDIQHPASIICITPEVTNKDPYRMTAEADNENDRIMTAADNPDS
jgi:hypothetical protein